MISEAAKTQIKNLDILSYIQDFVHLKKRGKGWTGNCPFPNHTDKTPSFSVLPSKNIFTCFGCGTGGDIISFEMLYANASYPNAVRNIAQKYGIEIEGHNELSKADSIYQLNKFVASFYSKNLVSEPFAYLHNRNISKESIDLFQIGYANDSFSQIKDLVGDQFSSEVIAQSGILTEKGFDFFRNRIMFPIHNVMGKIIGFSGRNIQDGKVKYLNTSETDIFKKSNELFGLYQAKKSIKEKDNCFLVEGQIDCISMVQAGIKNTVAKLGSSFGLKQAFKIQCLTDNITLVYDNDSAGNKALAKDINICLSIGLTCYVIILPTGHDPDSFIKEFGIDKTVSYFKEHRKDCFEYIVESIKDFSLNEKSDVINELIRCVQSQKDDVTRQLFLKKIEVYFGIKPNPQLVFTKENLVFEPKSKVSHFFEKEKMLIQFIILTEGKGYVDRESGEILYYSDYFLYTIKDCKFLCANASFEMLQFIKFCENNRSESIWYGDFSIEKANELGLLSVSNLIADCINLDCAPCEIDSGFFLKKMFLDLQISCIDLILLKESNRSERFSWIAVKNSIINEFYAHK